MIKIDRGPTPSRLSGQNDLNNDADLRQDYQDAGDNPSKMSWSKFGGRWRNDQVIDKLDDVFRKKCAYCESLVKHDGANNVEHFRPRVPYYWWLALKWENLFLACRGCNSPKSNHFPIEGPRATDNAGLSGESPKFINPCIEDPETIFEYDMDGNEAVIIAADNNEKERAETTIAFLKLNRDDLVRQRRGTLSFLKDALMTAENPQTPQDLRDIWERRIYSMADSTSSYAGLMRYYLRLHGYNV